MKEKFEGYLASTHLRNYSVDELLRAAKYQLQHDNVRRLRRTREASLVQTKIDEALLWYSQCDFIGDDE